jgi:hypothetical protein
MVCILLIGFASTAMAAASLQWNTDRVYYDSTNVIVIEGYFYNNGTRNITWVNWHNVKVYFKQSNTNWWLQAGTTYRDLNINLAPGDSIRWTFRITGVNYNYYDYYDVKWTVNYNYE